MLVHAYRRTGPIEVDLFGKVYKFAPNAAGEVVCDVEGKALERLLEIDDAYRLHGADENSADFDPDAEERIEIERERQAAEKAERERAERLLITDGDRTIDLRKLEGEALHKVAAEVGVLFHPNIGDEKLRMRIVEYVQAPKGA